MLQSLRSMKEKNNPWFAELTPREKEIVCYLDVTFPLDQPYKIGKEQCVDVPGL